MLYLMSGFSCPGKNNKGVQEDPGEVNLLRAAESLGKSHQECQDDQGEVIS